jgi:hypothetical protein
MPDEPTAAGREKENGASEMDLLERRLWRAGFIAALLFIGIAILIAGHHRRRVVMVAQPGCGMWMGQRGFGPPPQWGGPGEYGRGWGPGPWGNPQPYGPGQQAPRPSAPPRD